MTKKREECGMMLQLFSTGFLAFYEMLGFKK